MFEKNVRDLVLTPHDLSGEALFANSVYVVHGAERFVVLHQQLFVVRYSQAQKIFVRL